MNLLNWIFDPFSFVSFIYWTLFFRSCWWLSTTISCTDFLRDSWWWWRGNFRNWSSGPTFPGCIRATLYRACDGLCCLRWRRSQILWCKDLFFQSYNCCTLCVVCQNRHGLVCRLFLIFTPLIIYTKVPTVVFRLPLP